MKKLHILALSLAMLVATATSAFAATSGSGNQYGGTNYTPPTYSASDPSGTKFEANNSKYSPEDNFLGNANDTGLNVDGSSDNFADVIKSDEMTDNKGNTGTQRTHGEYQNNTNSCASCHQTHTGASKNLLFKNGVYNTCTACHDGTLGFYNVFANNDASDVTKSSTAGTFGGTQTGNASVHLADATVNISAAPGGNKVGTDAGWTSEFTCASCHEPHGSYSDRLLTGNPNDMANTPVADGGQKLMGVAVKDKDNYGTLTDANILVRSTAGQETNIVDAKEGILTTSPVIVLYKYNGTPGSYVRDTNPWFYGYDFDAAHNKINWLQIKDSNGADLKLTVNYGEAFATGTAAKVASATSGDITYAYTVKLQDATNPMTSIKDMGLFQVTAVDPGVYDNAGLGVQIGKFCAACHTDYRAGSGSETGMWSKAFRHTTNNDNYTCLKCHYAHGTDLYVMRDAKDNTVADLVKSGQMTQPVAEAYMIDKNPDSALKRYTNMAVCWKCHTSSHSEGTKNNTYYWNNYENPVTKNVVNEPNGFSAQFK